LLSVILSPSVRTFHHHVKGTPQRYSTGKGINQSEKACHPIHKLPLTIDLPSLRAFADAHGGNARHAAESDRGRNSSGGRESAPDDTLVESGHRQRQRHATHMVIKALLQIGPFVPVPKGHLSRFWNRDSAAGTKALEAFVPGGRTGTKCPSR